MDPTVPVDFVGLSVVQRNWLQVAVNEEIQFEPFQLSQNDRNSFAGLMVLEVRANYFGLVLISCLGGLYETCAAE